MEARAIFPSLPGVQHLVQGIGVMAGNWSLCGDVERQVLIFAELAGPLSTIYSGTPANLGTSADSRVNLLAKR